MPLSKRFSIIDIFYLPVLRKAFLAKSTVRGDRVRFLRESWWRGERQPQFWGERISQELVVGGN